MVGGLSDVTESTLHPRIDVKKSKIQNIHICTLIPLLFMYEALGWIIRVPNIYPTHILYLACHLTVPTRVNGLGVCFVYIPKVSTTFSSVSARNLPLIFSKALNWWPFVALLTICEYGANKVKEQYFEKKKHYDISVIIQKLFSLLRYECTCVTWSNTFKNY